MKLGVVLINWNGGEFTIPCIESLLGSTCSPWMIVVVDNASTDSSADQIQRMFPEVELLREKENLGFTGGNNKGITYLLNKGADIVWVLNNDTIVERHCVEIISRNIARHPECGVFTTKTFYANPKDNLWYAGGSADTWRCRAIHWGANDKDKECYSIAKPVTFVSGCSMVIRADVLKAAGLFREEYFMYYEDTEWSMRAAKHGVKMRFVPDAIIWHKVSATQKKHAPLSNKGRTSAQEHYFESRNRLYTIRIHAKGLKKLTSFCSYLASSCYLTAGLILFRRWSKIAALWKGFLHGMVNHLN